MNKDLITTGLLSAGFLLIPLTFLIMQLCNLPLVLFICLIGLGISLLFSAVMNSQGFNLPGCIEIKQQAKNSGELDLIVGGSSNHQPSTSLTSPAGLTTELSVGRMESTGAVPSTIANVLFNMGKSSPFSSR